VTTVPHDDEKALGANALDDAIHALAQPLTALLFQLELGALKTDPQSLRETLDDALVECLRSIEALKQIRSIAHALGKPGELS
jgi:hypothetical protein